jgi:hypothetical protein
VINAGPQRREKEFPIPLSGDEILHVRIVRENGTVTEFCVSYELFVMGVSYQPCRIDNSHGIVHLDVFDARGTRIDQQDLEHIEPRLMVPESLNRMKIIIKYHRARIIRELVAGW